MCTPKELDRILNAFLGVSQKIFGVYLKGEIIKLLEDIKNK